MVFGNPSTDVLTGLSGNTVRIIVRALNTGSSDFHSIDNIVVNCHNPSDNPYALAWTCTAATTDSYSTIIVIRKNKAIDTMVRIYLNPADDKINLQFLVDYWNKEPIKITL